MSNGTRPTVATVFAILHFVFGALGIIFGLIGLGALFALRQYVSLFFSLLSFCLSGFMIYAGVTLFTDKKNAVEINKLYAFASAGLTVINFIVFKIMGYPYGMFGLLLGLIYPALLFFLVVQNENVKKFYS